MVAVSPASRLLRTAAGSTTGPDAGYGPERQSSHLAAAALGADGCDVPGPASLRQGAAAILLYITVDTFGDYG
jgi:hypothetical protein